MADPQESRVLQDIWKAFEASLHTSDYEPVNTSETARMDGEILAPEPENNEADSEELVQEEYHANMLCPGCKKTSVFSFKKMFEKVVCAECRSSFRVPVNAEEFIFDKHVLGLPNFNIFRAYNKENEFYGDVVIYDQQGSCELDEVVQVVRNFSQLQLSKYVSPHHFQVDDKAYYLTRPQAAYQMQIYLDQDEETSNGQLATILDQATVLLMNLSQHQVIGEILPSDICLNSEGQVEICDYGLREALFAKLGTHLPYTLLAPEIIAGGQRNEASLVYSLGILAATLLKKEPPFKELDPQLINQERENYIENFQETKLPGFLKLLLKVTPKERPPLMQCRDFFLRLSRQRK